MFIHSRTKPKGYTLHIKFTTLNNYTEFKQKNEQENMHKASNYTFNKSSYVNNFVTETVFHNYYLTKTLSM